ncbi:MAG: hypothetical protein AAF984_08595 [Verrucomicrobiota bacterium]
MFIKRKGSFWGGDCVVKIENFVRGGNPEKPQKGQVLWKAKFNNKPSFMQMEKPYRSNVIVYVPNFGGLLGMRMEENDDDIYFNIAGWGDSSRRRVNKWSMQTSATVEPRLRGKHLGAYQLNVFARGTAIAKYYKTEHKDGTKEWQHKSKKFVDELCFNLVHIGSGQEIASWWVPGDLAPEDGDLHQETPVFLLDLVGGWWKKKPIVKTAQGWDPVFGLLVAYLCAYEYSPKEIKHDLESKFPQRPPPRY